MDRAELDRRLDQIAAAKAAGQREQAFYRTHGLYRDFTILLGDGDLEGDPVQLARHLTWRLMQIGRDD